MPDRFDAFGERCAGAYSDADRAMYGRDGGMEPMAKEKLAHLIAAQAREAFGGGDLEARLLAADLRVQHEFNRDPGPMEWPHYVAIRKRGLRQIVSRCGATYDEALAAAVGDIPPSWWPADAEGVLDGD